MNPGQSDSRALTLKTTGQNYTRVCLTPKPPILPPPPHHPCLLWWDPYERKASALCLGKNPRELEPGLSPADVSPRQDFLLTSCLGVQENLQEEGCRSWGSGEWKQEEVEAGKGGGGGEVTPGKNAAPSENSGKTALARSLRHQTKPTLRFSSFPQCLLGAYCAPGPSKGLGTRQGTTLNKIPALMELTFCWGRDQPRTRIR